MLPDKRKLQLISSISALLVIGFLATSFSSYFVSRSSLRTEISHNALPLTSDNIYSEIQRDLLSPVFISSLMATDTFLRDWVLNGEKEEEKITRYLKEIQKQYNTFTSFFVSENTRNYYHSDGILKKVSQEEERDRWYFRVRDMQDDYEINVDPDLANKDAMTIFINYKVYDYEGKYIGATGVGLTVTAVQDLIKSYQEKYSRTIYFIDTNGNIKLSGSDLGNTITNISQLASYPVLRNNIHSRSDISFAYNTEGQVVHTNVRYIDEFGWHLIVEQSEQEVIKHIFTTLLINLVICVFITIIVLFLINLAVTAYQKKIDTLRGIVPICSFCKQIRDDKGYWNRVELYVEKYTEAQFSHAICPTCMEEHYPDDFRSVEKNGEDQ